LLGDHHAAAICSEYTSLFQAAALDVAHARRYVQISDEEYASLPFPAAGADPVPSSWDVWSDDQACTCKVSSNLRM